MTALAVIALIIFYLVGAFMLLVGIIGSVMGVKGSGAGLLGGIIYPTTATLWLVALNALEVL